MNFIKKYKLDLVIDEKAEMLESYKTKIENYIKNNMYGITWVYHLTSNELKSIGLTKPWECAYYRVQGNPNPPRTTWDSQRYTRPQNRRLLPGQTVEEYEESERILRVAKQWAKTIGAKEVLVFKTNTSIQYVDMINDFVHEVTAFIELNKSVHGELRETKWKSMIKFAQEKVKELQDSYVIERQNKI